MQQQNTVTVKAVHDDGSADIENHFDKFEFQSDLAQRAPDSFRDSAESAQQEISEHVAGQDIVAHFDRKGKLLGFEGGEGLFEQLDRGLSRAASPGIEVFPRASGRRHALPRVTGETGEDVEEQTGLAGQRGISV